MSLQAASNFLTTPFPQEEPIYGATVNTTTGSLGSGFTATVVISQVVSGSIGGMVTGVATIPHQTSTGEIGSSSSGKAVTNDLVSGAIGSGLSGSVKNNEKATGAIGNITSGKVVTNDLVSGEVGSSLSGFATTNYTVTPSVHISGSGFANTNKTVIGLTEDADVVVHSQGVGANDLTELADFVPLYGGEDILTEIARTIFPFVEHFYSELSATIAANETATIPHQAVSGEIGDSASGEVVTNEKVKGEIGNALTETPTISQSVKGEIGDTLRGTVVTHDLVAGEIGSSDSGRAQTGDFDTTAESRIRLSAVVVVNQKVKGSIGNALSSAVATGQKVLGYISSSLFGENQEIISQAVKGEIGNIFTQKERTTTSASGSIGAALPGVVRTNDIVFFNIGSNLTATQVLISQSVRGEIGDQTSLVVVVHNAINGFIGIRPNGKAYRLSIIPATIQTFQTPSKKKRLKTFAKKLLLQAEDNP